MEKILIKRILLGDFDAMFNKLHGKELSYNNLLDVDAANFSEFKTDDPTFAILKTITLVALLQEKR
jgi:phosphoribosylaminoimidazolecarboxamide formyltransferase/IMP cyclohydrolase